jgi:hypothetical protein
MLSTRFFFWLILPFLIKQQSIRAESNMFLFLNHSESLTANEKGKHKHRLDNLLAALSFEPIHFLKSPKSMNQNNNDRTKKTNKNKPLVPPSSLQSENSRALRKPKKGHCYQGRIVLGTLDPEGNGVETTFYDAHEYGNGKTVDEFDSCSEEGSTEMIPRGGHTETVSLAPTASTSSASLSPRQRPMSCQAIWQAPLPPPTPPSELPERFLRAGKGNVDEGWRRYRATLQWRKEMGIDTILRRPNPRFALIKQHYLHYFHMRGKNNEPCFYEIPAKTNLKALREGGVSVEDLLQHYAMIVEYQWQIVERSDSAKSLYIIDLQGIRFGDFMGDVMDFVKRASAFCNQHYPERAGTVYIINVPSWFKMIWSVVKPWVDPVTLEKIHILRGAEEIRQTMQQRIALEHLPPEYGGTSMPLGQSPEEVELWARMEHNNRLALCTSGDDAEKLRVCGGRGQCRFCSMQLARSY